MHVPEIRVLFRIPIPGTHGIPIFWYGVMLLTGFLFGMIVAKRLAKREGVPREAIYDLAIWALVSGIIGARLWFVFENWGTVFAPDPKSTNTFWHYLGRALNVTDGGLVYYGGIIAPVLVLIGWFRRHRLPALKMFDVLAPAAMLGLVFGRIGCLFNGCCFGAVAEGFPLAIERPIDGPTGQFQVAHELVDSAQPPKWSLPVYPTQVFEAVGALAICGLLVFLYRRKKRDGDILAWLLLLYPVLRIVGEALRAHEPAAIVAGAAGKSSGLTLTVAQVFSLASFLLGLGMILAPWARPLAVPFMPPPGPAPDAKSPDAKAPAPASPRHERKSRNDRKRSRHPQPRK